MNIDLFNKLEPLIISTATKAAEDVYRKLGTQFGVSEIPRHEHNGVDAPNIPYSSIRGATEAVHHTIVGADAATAANYGVFWIAPAPCSVIAFFEAHQTKGTDGSAVTLQLEKLLDGEAPNAGVVLLQTALSLKATINTYQQGDIVKTATTAGVLDATLVKGDRLCLKDTGTLTAVANVTTVTVISYQ